MTPKPIHLRAARPDEEAWINARYAEIGFVPSHLAGELVAIAEIEGSAAGLGRMVDVDANTQELGGMYVFPEFRKRGVAAAIVSFLLEHRKEGVAVYCLPFEHLQNFYRGFGFVDATPPAALEQKHRWCNTTYTGRTLCFRLGAS